MFDHEDGTVEFFKALLGEQLGIKPAAQVEIYAKTLVGQGYDFDLFCELSSEELTKEFGFLPGHIKRVEKHLPDVVLSMSNSEPQELEASTTGQSCRLPYGATSGEAFSVTYTGHTIVGPPEVEDADTHVKYKFTAVSRSTGAIEFSERYSELCRRHDQLLASQAFVSYSPKMLFPGKGAVLPWLPGSDGRIAARGNELQHYIQRLVTEASVDTLLQLSTCWTVGYILYTATTTEDGMQSQVSVQDALELSELEAAISTKMADVRAKKLRKSGVETVVEAVRDLQELKKLYLDRTGRAWEAVDKTGEARENNPEAATRALTTQQITGICDALMSVDTDGSVLPKYRYASAGSLYPVQVYFSIRQDTIEGLNGGCYYYKPSTHCLHKLHEDMQSPPAESGNAAGASTNDSSAFVIFLIGDLAAIEPLYGEHSFNFMMLEAGYITELLMATAPKQQISLRECPLPDEVLDSCNISQELRNSFCLSDTHRLLHCLLGSSAQGVKPT